jgi:hypothetical protein
MATLIALFKRQIRPGGWDTLTTHEGSAVTLWVERGRIEVTRELGAKPFARVVSPGPVPMGPGPIHVRTIGRQGATVFVAIADVGAVRTAGEPVHAGAKSGDLATAAPDLATAAPDFAGDEPPPTGMPPPTAAPVGSAVKRFNLFCDTHNLVNPSPLRHAKCVQLQNQHIADNAACGTRTRIREAP